ncbi:MAG: DUF4831 family protein [Chlorobi bacterium]|nr:DUF4831 family protein [Chlorobiota bacterium]
MIKKVFVFIIVIIITSCKTEEIVSTYQTVNLKKTQSYINYKNPLVYYLPRNIIRVDFELQKTIFTAGPYAQFAQKYLGIENAITKDFDKWEITNITINVLAIPDTNQIYIIENENFRNNINLLSLSESGIIQGINCKVQGINKFENLQLNSSNLFADDNNFQFTNLSVKPNIVEKTERTYNRVKTDSSYIKVPVTKKVKISKSLEEKAEEAAAFILKLRKRRFKLVAGMNETQPDGLAVKNMVEVLNKMEEDYIHLFVGKEEQKVNTYSCYFNPEPDSAFSRKLLFKFSPVYGIIGSDKITRVNIQKSEYAGEPVIINIEPVTSSVRQRDFERIQNNKFKEKTGFYYRIPALVKVEIIQNMEIVFSKEILMAQYGQSLALPVDLLNDENVKVEYYEKYGSIKSISK